MRRAHLNIREITKYTAIIIPEGADNFKQLHLNMNSFAIISANSDYVEVHTAAVVVLLCSVGIS